MIFLSQVEHLLNSMSLSKLRELVMDRKAVSYDAIFEYLFNILIY